MNHELLFTFLSYSPGPFWLSLILMPGNRRAMRFFDGYLILLSAVFTWQTLPVVPSLLPVIASPTLGAVQALLGSSGGTVGAWNHMILADLWIGRWMIHDALSLGMPNLLRIPFLVTIMFFGPLGLFSYLVCRSVLKRKFSLIP